MKFLRIPFSFPFVTIHNGITIHVELRLICANNLTVYHNNKLSYRYLTINKRNCRSFLGTKYFNFSEFFFTVIQIFFLLEMETVLFDVPNEKLNAKKSV